MAPALAIEALLGQHLADALAAIKAAGEPEPTIARTAPTRTRHALPETVDWRVARARRVGDSIALVAVAALPLPTP
jgi:hypothetical protein